MKRSLKLVGVGPYLVGWCVALAGAPEADAQGILPYQPLGIANSQTAEVEILPGVRLPGLQILGVIPGSPAARANLEAGDVILAAGSRRVIEVNDLWAALPAAGQTFRLKVFDFRTEQILNVTVAVGPASPAPPPPTPITVTGRLTLGVFAPGGETTGTTLTTAQGKTYDLEFRGIQPPDPRFNGRRATVTGTLRISPGPEIPGRPIIRVSSFRVLGG